MKKILSNSKMREVLPLEPKKGVKERIAVFEKGKVTELENSDFKYLKDKENGPFTFLLTVGDFIDVTPNADKPAPEVSKFDGVIIKMQAEKKSVEAQNKVFPVKAQAKLDKLLAEQKLANEAAAKAK